MCGIAGFFSLAGHSPETALERIKGMNSVLVHRGPDECGEFVDGHVALGHRRLSIIDLSSGSQPMSDSERGVHIVFNGEIYNFVEIRRELCDRGHRFRTQSDTEVLLRAYIEWGSRFVSRLNGMFAFAIWDSRNRELILARDRVGKKPLFVYASEHLIAFASELKALRAIGITSEILDVESLDCFFTLGYVPSPRSIFRDVKKLRPAHVVSFSSEGTREFRYWDLHFKPKVGVSEEEVVEELGALLDDAVKCRLVSDVPIGAFLSSGVDSSLVVSSMVLNSAEEVATHTIGFSEREFDETKWAGDIARSLGTRHQEYVVAPKAVDVLERLAWHLEEPLADSSALATWYVCEMTRTSVTVALSGDGGDEAFGGYTFRYLPHVLESRLRRTLSPLLRSALFGTVGSFWPGSPAIPRPLRLKTIWQNLAIGDMEAFYRDLAWLGHDDRREVYARSFTDSLMGFTPEELIDQYYSSGNAADALSRCQFTDINVYMTDDVLAKVDRMSMAHSLEVRAPLLDYRILEFAASIPSNQKMSWRKGKLPLRALAKRRLPSFVQSLPKRGFSVPTSSWLRKDLREFAHDVIFSASNRGLEFLNRVVIERLWREHQERQRDHSVFLWGLLMFALWSRAGQQSPKFTGS